MVVDIKTPYLHLPLPHEDNRLEEDWPRFRDTLQKVDAFAEEVTGKIDLAAEVIGGGLDDEIDDRIAADKVLQDALSAEVAARKSAVSEVRTAVDAIRHDVDSAVQAEVDGVTGDLAAHASQYAPNSGTAGHVRVSFSSAPPIGDGVEGQIWFELQ